MISQWIARCENDQTLVKVDLKKYVDIVERYLKNPHADVGENSEDRQDIVTQNLIYE